MDNGEPNDSFELYAGIFNEYALNIAEIGNNTVEVTIQPLNKKMITGFSREEKGILNDYPGNCLLKFLRRLYMQESLCLKIAI